MENNFRKDLLIDLFASLIGLVLVLYSLIILEEPDALGYIIALLGVGVFLFGSVRYSMRYRKLQKKQKH